MEKKEKIFYVVFWIVFISVAVTVAVFMIKKHNERERKIEKKYLLRANHYLENTIIFNVLKDNINFNIYLENDTIRCECKGDIVYKDVAYMLSRENFYKDYDEKNGELTTEDFKSCEIVDYLKIASQEINIYNDVIKSISNDKEGFYENDDKTIDEHVYLEIVKNDKYKPILEEAGEDDLVRAKQVVDEINFARIYYCCLVRDRYDFYHKQERYEETCEKLFRLYCERYCPDLDEEEFLETIGEKNIYKLSESIYTYYRKYSKGSRENFMDDIIYGKCEDQVLLDIISNYEYIEETPQVMTAKQVNEYFN